MRGDVSRRLGGRLRRGEGLGLAESRGPGLGAKGNQALMMRMMSFAVARAEEESTQLDVTNRCHTPRG